MAANGKRHRLLKLLFLLGIAVPAACAGSATHRVDFVAEDLSGGVWLFRPAEPSPLAANSVVVERDDGLLVIDAQPTPETAARLVKAISRRFDRPIRFLVLSHPHAEASGGASAFPESVLIAASEGYEAALSDPDFDYGAETRLASEDPRVWTRPPIRKPTLLVRGQIRLDDERNPLLLTAVGHAHAPGDLTVQIPRAAAVYLGGLTFHHSRQPYGAQANLGRWIGALAGALQEAPNVVIGLHGSAIRPADLRRQRDALAWVRAEVESCWIDGIAPEEMTEHILGLDRAADYFAPGGPAEHVPALVQSAVRESVAQRKKRGRL